nr:hypothetical protein [Tanacetum cinerariifolium]
MLNNGQKEGQERNLNAKKIKHTVVNPNSIIQKLRPIKTRGRKPRVKITGDIVLYYQIVEVGLSKHGSVHIHVCFGHYKTEKRKKEYLKKREPKSEQRGSTKPATAPLTLDDNHPSCVVSLRTVVQTWHNTLSDCPYVLLLWHGTGDSGPDMSFDTSASLEYMSGLGRASLAKLV